MKVLLLAPTLYTLDKTIGQGFFRLGNTVVQHDYRSANPAWKNRFNVQAFRLPYSIRRHWEARFLQDINYIHKKTFEQEQPDLVFIYNNEMLLPETIRHFKQQKAKILFFMGDNPFYTPTNNYYLALLREADLIISPDTFWMEQLKTMGIHNTIFDFPGYNDTLYNEIEISTEFLKENATDILFVGTSYVDSWGYKRTLFLSHFSKFDLKIYGTKHWLKWLPFFPELEQYFHLLEHRIPHDLLKKIIRCAKLYPVDANPGILNGVHLRIFETISNGILPLVEYRKDVCTVFKDVNIPVIKDYSKAEEIAKKYIENDDIRISTLKNLQSFIKENFSPEQVVNRILEHVF